MGNPKQKWTQEEEDALRQGVAKHGTGKWKDIQRDPEFNKFLFSRSNIDLKDKWRNLIGGGSGQVQRDKSRAKAKAVADPNPSFPNLAIIPIASIVDEATREAAIHGSAKLVDESKSVPRYDEVISEALSNLNEPNGSEVGAIFSYIEKSHEVSQNFRRQLRARLKKLVVLGKLEENQNRYKQKEGAHFVAKTPAKIPATREQDTRPRLPQIAGGAIFEETLDEAAIACAYRIAEAENKSFVAAEAVKEAERVAKMAEDAEYIYQFTREMLERCSGDKITLGHGCRKMGLTS